MRTLSMVRHTPLLMPCLAVFYVIVLVLSTQSAAAFVVAGRRNVASAQWHSVFPLNLSYNGFPASTRSDAAAGAFQWDDVNTGARFQYDENRSSWTVYVSETGFLSAGFDPSIPGVTVHRTDSNGRITYSNIWLNHNYFWDGNCRVDFDNTVANTRIVLTHEFGHTLNLNHDINHQEAVMWPDGRCKLTTVTDDDNGAKNIYGLR